MLKGIEMSAHGLSARPFRWLWGPLGRPQSFSDSSEAWGPENPFRVTAAAAKLLQSCPTLCDPRDSSPPGSPIPGILQARTLEWVSISFFNAWKWNVKVKSLSRVWLLATPWTAAHQALPSMGFSRQEYYSGVPLPSPSEWLGWSKVNFGGSWKGFPLPS